MIPQERSPARSWEEFRYEIGSGRPHSASAGDRQDLSIVAVVGEKTISTRVGICGGGASRPRAENAVNVTAIAQGSSELNFRSW